MRARDVKLNNEKDVRYKNEKDVKLRRRIERYVKLKRGKEKKAKLTEKRERERCEAEERNEGAEALLELDRAETCCDSSTVTQQTLDEITQLREENEHLLKENSTLKEENAAMYKEIATLKKGMITLEALMVDNGKVKYYTGLPSFEVLKAIFDFVQPCVNNYSRTTLPLLNQFLMVLVRLRINMDVQQLAYHFGIHSSNISCTFRKWINVVYERLKPPIKWPEREQLCLTMPMVFREKFRNA